MNDEDISKILKIIIDSTNDDKNIIWRLDGSANLKVQGIPVSVRDLDINTNQRGLDIFRSTLSEYIKKDFFNEKIQSNSLLCDIHGFEVEINNYKNENLNMFKYIEKITWNGLTVPILPIKKAKEFYEMIGRKQKVELISKYL